jgi:hypothetical protein
MVLVAWLEYRSVGEDSPLKLRARGWSIKPVTQTKVVDRIESTKHSPGERLEEQTPGDLRSKELFRRRSRKGRRHGKSYGKICHKVELSTQGDPDTQRDRRGPPTDRPPDKPPPWKGAVRGSLQERAGSRHASQLLSARGINGLSGNAALLQKMQIEVQTPSNQCHASQAGSSHGRAGGLVTIFRGRSSPFPYCAEFAGTQGTTGCKESRTCEIFVS